MNGKSTLAVSSIALTVLFAVLSLFPEILPFQRILFSFFFIYIVIVPGLLLSARIIPAATGLIHLMAALVFGTALSFAALLIITLARLDVTTMRFIIPATVVILAVWQPKRVTAGKKPDDTFNAEMDVSGAFFSPWPSWQEKRAGIIILLLLMAGILFLVLSGGDPVLLTGDSPDHIAWISAISRTHEAFPDRFYYPDGGILTHDIRKGMMHALLGSVNALTGRADAWAIWPVVSAIGALSMILALYCAGLVLFSSQATGLVAVFIFIFLYRGGLGGYHLVSTGTGYLLGRAYYIAALMTVPALLRSGDRRLLLLLSAASIAATGAHIAHFVVIAFMCAVVFILLFTAKKRGRRSFTPLSWILIPAALVAAVNIPYLLLRYFRDYAPANPLHTHTQGVMYITERFFVLNPVVFMQETGFTGILALAALFILWKASRRDDSLRLLFSLQIAYYILVFTPILFPLLHEKLSYLLIRMEFVAPSIIVSSFLITALWNGLRGTRRNIGRSALAAGWLAVILFAVLPAVNSIRAFAYSPHEYGQIRAQSALGLSDLYDHINNNIAGGGVILSDPVTSFSLPAFTAQYVVCPYDQHSTPNDSTAIERLRDCRSVFSPLATPLLVARAMEKYGADYILVNGRLPGSIRTMYWLPGRDESRALVSMLESAPGVFNKVFEADEAVLFRYDREMAHAFSLAAHPRPFFGNELSPEELAGARESGEKGIVISRLETRNSVVKRGETFEAVIHWALNEPVYFGSYMAHVRFDTDFPRTAFYWQWYGKIYRKILEKIKGTRYRFRADNQPLGGILPPDTWPLATDVADSVVIKIPHDAAPGLYTISVRMSQTTQYPNYRAKDILTDDDFFSGTNVGRLIIE
ncbi:MAG: hypothetical protein MUF59_06910 [Candidatus Krumholzibacteria bacterium]|nr:hypothetical protein [Candidatus Krumholzibacteria bacterium]